VAELRSVPNNVWTVQNAQFRAEPTAVPAPSMPRSTSGTAFRQVPPKLHFLAIARIGKAIDRLVADADAAAFISQSTGNLLW
jgi:hypothetical protein